MFRMGTEACRPELRMNNEFGEVTEWPKVHLC